MGGVKSLSSGLLTGLIVAATVLGALVLSVRSGRPTAISELPIPTVTLQEVFPSPTRSATPPITAIAAAPSQTPTPTPTICPIPPDWQRYSVGPFDTLISIALRFNLSPDQLVQTNCLSEAKVIMGQTIYVPAFRPTPTSLPCYPPFNWFVYIVQPGDTLSSIAYRYGISVYTLMRANCLSTTYIYYGQRLYVPPIYPIVTPTFTPIVPTFTPTPLIGSLTPTMTPTDTPTPLPTTPVITDTPSPTATPGPTDTSTPTDTPVPTDTLEPTVTSTAVPTEPPPDTLEPSPLTVTP